MAPKTEPSKKTQAMRKLQQAKPPIKAKQTITKKPAKKKKAVKATQPAKKKKPPKKEPVIITLPAKKKKLVTTTQPVKKKKPPKKEPVTTTRPAKNKKPPEKEPVTTTQTAKKQKPPKKKQVTTTQTAKKKKPLKKVPVTTTQPAKQMKPPKKAPVTTTQPPKKKNLPKKTPVTTTQPVKKTKLPKKVPATTTRSAKKMKPPKKARVTTTQPAKKKKPPKKARVTTTQPAKKKNPPKNEQKGKTKPTKKKLKPKSLKANSTSEVKHNLDKTFFSVLQNYGTEVTKTNEVKYPWIARVVHSKTKDYPFKCSASCIGPRLFVTAARCITILVVEYTHVKYAGVRMPVVAFVVPSHPTKQMYDDIGIIVVEATSYKGSWPRISLTEMKRTDDDYKWLDKLQLEKAEFGTHVVVGYAKEDSNQPHTVYEEFKLSSLDVVVGLSLCYKILQEKNPKSPDYWVPCYHSCSVKQYYEHDSDEDDTCYKYLGALGAAVIDSKTNTLIGVTTWGARYTDWSVPPVGFAIPNSENFFEDLACAKKVLKDNGATADMQSLCPLPKKKLK